jgi:hypothetical protein
LDLANIVWRALSGAHARLATGTAEIRRYAKGYTPLIGYADTADPPFEGARAVLRHWRALLLRRMARQGAARLGRRAGCLDVRDALERRGARRKIRTSLRCAWDPSTCRR